MLSPCKVPQIFDLLRMIRTFQKTCPRGCEILESFTGIGRSEILFELLDKRKGSWLFYKVICITFEHWADFLEELPHYEMKKITKRVCSGSYKWWKRKYPKSPISPIFTLDTDEN